MHQKFVYICYQFIVKQNYQQKPKKKKEEKAISGQRHNQTASKKSLEIKKYKQKANDRKK